MKFSYSAIWNDTMRLLSGNMSLLLTIAAAFMFLPSLIFSYLVPVPGASGATPTGDQMLQYYGDNVWWMVLVGTIGFIGNLAMLILMLDERRPTVGAALSGALALLWVYFTISLLSGLVIGIGLLLLVLPGLYAAARLSVVGPVLVCEPKQGAIGTMKRSLELTRGRGWAILGLMVLIVIAYAVISTALTLVLGSAFLLIDKGSGSGVGAFLNLALGAALGAVFNTVFFALLAAIYRNLGAEGSVRQVFD